MPSNNINGFQRLKQAIQKIIWPYNSTATIIKGQLKGYRFIVTENSGWSPIVGRWEPESHEIFKHLIQPGQTVFDLGANNGIHSLIFSKLVGKSGKVYAFEPLYENIQEINKNCSLNNINNIHVVEAAAGNRNGTVKFLIGLLNKQGSIAGIGRESGRELDVKLITLKAFIINERVRPDFLKIDIEGAEADALEGMEDLISELKPIFFIELHTPEQDRKVGKIFIKNNYHLYRQVHTRKAGNYKTPYLEKIKNLSLGYPHPDGIWGTVVALPADRQLI